jgi:hypothetical protein
MSRCNEELRIWARIYDNRLLKHLIYLRRPALQRKLAA